MEGDLLQAGKVYEFETIIDVNDDRRAGNYEGRATLNGTSMLRFRSSEDDSIFFVNQYHIVVIWEM